MLVLGVYLFILFHHVDFKVPVGFPLRLLDFYHGDFFRENSLADVVSEELFAYRSIFLALIHEVSEEKREVDRIVEQGLGRKSKKFVLDEGFLFYVQIKLVHEQLVHGETELGFVF
jgi:hypothetical protein